MGNSLLPLTLSKAFLAILIASIALKGHSQASAQKHLQLFMLGYLFTIGSNWQSCPLEKVGYDVSRVPFYHLLNRPNITALKQLMAA